EQLWIDVTANLAAVLRVFDHALDTGAPTGLTGPNVFADWPWTRMEFGVDRIHEAAARENPIFQIGDEALHGFFELGQPFWRAESGFHRRTVIASARRRDRRLL